MKKKRKRPSDKYMNDLWSAKVKKDANYTCKKCGTTSYKGSGELESHHIFKRKALSTRYELENGMCLCIECHDWAELHPANFQIFARSVLGDDFINKLAVKERTLAKYLDYEEIKAELKK